jgi:hypothetical protein
MGTSAYRCPTAASQKISHGIGDGPQLTDRKISGSLPKTRHADADAAANAERHQLLR